MDKKLTRSNDRKLLGVCAGIAEYFDIDPTLIRVLYACITVFTAFFTGIILYIMLALIIPDSKS